ncbi:hypothetical protein ACN27J_30130 [Solwaraspora sp. WMMB762]|uniref:hypothetical protein n=1 Tax=Solwaraspora sp. WMMB762 TaxID=3404120 RepID=UPI003B93233C
MRCARPPVSVMPLSMDQRAVDRCAGHRQPRRMLNMPADYRSYGDRKPYVVADTLTALTGPAEGVVTLPHHLDWSGHAEYDLNRPARLVSMYKVVLTEAGSVDDLNTWLNADLLRRLWPALWLPTRLRRLWEGTFPELRRHYEPLEGQHRTA